MTATNLLGELSAHTTVTIAQEISGLVATNDGPTRLGQATNFTATIAAGSGASYNWSFGNGAIGSGSVVSYTYPSPGIYTSTVTATNLLGELSAHTTVTVAQEVSGLVATNDSPTQLGQATGFTATITAGSGESYAWSFGNGAIGSGNVVSYTYPSPGIFTAVVTASNVLA